VQEEERKTAALVNNIARQREILSVKYFGLVCESVCANQNALISVIAAGISRAARPSTLKTADIKTNLRSRTERRKQPKKVEKEKIFVKHKNDPSQQLLPAPKPHANPPALPKPLLDVCRHAFWSIFPPFTLRNSQCEIFWFSL
jgi:hypothetical protein